MKLSQIVVLCFSLALVPVSLSGQATPQWAQDWLAKWYVASNAEDASALAKLYAEDAVLSSSAGSPIRGRSAIEANFQKEFDSEDAKVKGAIDSARVMNDLAILWGHDEVTSTPEGGGETSTRRIKWLGVLEKQSDGSWLAIRDTSSRAESERQ